MLENNSEHKFQIARLSIPAILSNIAVPLLGLSDTTISGHLGDERFIGAIAVGSMMFNAVFWLFGFLRMGTTGLVAQAFGNKNDQQIRVLFCRASVLALSGSLLLILLRPVIIPLLLWYIAPSENVAELAAEYFSICIWGAPSILLVNVINGWFLGMQDTLRPMIISVFTATLNIALSLFLVFVFNMGFVGVAIGTLCSGWIGLFLAIISVWFFYDKKLPASTLKIVFARNGWNKFFKVNSDIFFRTLCIMTVSISVTSYGAQLGELTLAANAIMMQFFVIFSYFMDGLAFAAEALSGKFLGANRIDLLWIAIRRLIYWSMFVAGAFTLIYLFGYEQIASFITSKQDVVNEVCRYEQWMILLPVTTVVAFLMDGVYIGLTATRRMLISTLLSTVIFFMICFLPGIVKANRIVMPDNNLLWTAFLSYLFARGILLAAMLKRVVMRI